MSVLPRALLFAAALFVLACGSDTPSSPDDLSDPTPVGGRGFTRPEVPAGPPLRDPRPSPDSPPASSVGRTIPPFEDLILFRDIETGSTWNMLGEALSGPLRGERLEPLPGYTAYWFGWSSFWQYGGVFGEDDGEGSVSPERFIAVPEEQIIGSVSPDAIPPLNSPAFLRADQGHHVSDDDIVVGFALNGDARAYPINILNWHEIVNHRVGGEAVAVTYCPLTASAIAYRPAAEGKLISFGNTGSLYNNNLVMYDLTSKSFWSQMLGAAIVGRHVGTRLEMLPVVQCTWAAWKALYPDTKILSTSTGSERNYREDIYSSTTYRTDTSIPFTQSPHLDPRHHPKEMVFGLLGSASAKAYPYVRMSEIDGGNAVINDRFEGPPIVVVFQESAQLAVAFSSFVDGKDLTFELSP